MKLRKKIILIILLSYLFFMSVSAIGVRTFIREGFLDLEREEMGDEVDSFHYLLDSELQNLSTLADDWAVWDDTYRFLLDGNQQYIRSNLVDSTFRDFNLAYVLYIDNANRVVFGTAYNHQTYQQEAVKKDVLAFFLDQKSKVLDFPVSGYYADDDRLLLFSINPVFTSLGEGPSPGVIIFAKYFDDELANHLANALKSDFNVKPFGQTDFKQFKQYSGKRKFFYDDHNRDIIRFFSTINDLDGKPIFEVEQTLPRTLYQRGLESMRQLLLLLSLAFLLMSGISILFLERSFFSRLSNLMLGIKNYESGNNPHEQSLILSGSDELSQLSEVIQQSLFNLEQAKSELDNHLELERLMVETSTKFINLPIDELDEGINQLLKTIGEFVHADCGYILKQRSSQPLLVDNTHLWCSFGKKSLMAEIEGMDWRQCSWLLTQIQSGEPLFIDDINELPQNAQTEKEAFLSHSVQSFACIPLFISNKPAGVLGFHALKEPIQWSDQTRILLGVVSGIISGAFDRQQHENYLMLSRERQFRLNQIVRQSIRITNLETACRSISFSMKSLINADDTLLLLKTNHNKLAAFLSGKKIEVNDQNHGLFTRLYHDAERKTQILQYDKDKLDNPDGSLFAGTLIAVPMITGDKTIGVAVWGFRNQHNASNEECLLCEQAASTVALAIVKNKALESARQRTEELEALRDIIADITSELEIKKLLHIILERAIKFLHADGGNCCIYEEDEGALKVVAISNIDNKFLNTRINLNEGAAGKAAREKRTIIIEDYPGWNAKIDAYEDAGVRSVMIAPLIVGERILGTVGIFHSSPEKRFSRNDRRLLTLFAQHASIALDNALLFEKVQELARIDEVTGFLNRRAFMERAEEEIQRAKRLGQPITLAMIDLDNFKQVNDIFGHQVGDQILQEISRLMRASIRNIDIVCRYGGDEFVILMPETTEDKGLNAMKRLNELLSNHVFEQEGQSFVVTNSIGLAPYSKASDSLEKMICDADEAMYRAKTAGKCRVSL